MLLQEKYLFCFLLLMFPNVLLEINCGQNCTGLTPKGNILHDIRFVYIYEGDVAQLVAVGNTSDSQSVDACQS